MTNKHFVRRVKVQFFHNIKEQVHGIILGSIFSGILSLTLWSFAYFGYTDLALPDRFNYERVNHTVNTYLPSDYNKKELVITSFRQGGDETLVYIGQLKEFYYPDKDKSSDILLFFDKANKAYRLSYRFSPQRTLDEFTYPMHVVAADITDLNSDGRNDMVIAFAEMGAHWSPPFLAVIYSDGNSISVAGAPDQLSRYKSRDMIQNSFDANQRISGNRADHIFAGNGLIAYVTRTDNECYGCSESHVFDITYLELFEGKLVQTNSTEKNIEGYGKLTSLLSEKGIGALQYTSF